MQPKLKEEKRLLFDEEYARRELRQYYTETNASSSIWWEARKK
jgi:hypothetical protein